MNTWGLYAINRNTLNDRRDCQWVAPPEVRNVFITALKIHNTTFNILGYIPGISCVSGLVRAGLGVCLLGYVLSVGSPNREGGRICGHFYNELLQTAGAQIARGLLESVVPFGCLVNAALDLTCTAYNIKEVYYDGPKPEHMGRCEGWGVAFGDIRKPQPEYRGLFWLLNMA
jgi:hypothetical protein